MSSHKNDLKTMFLKTGNRVAYESNINKIYFSKMSSRCKIKTIYFQIINILAPWNKLTILDHLVVIQVSSCGHYPLATRRPANYSNFNLAT